MNKEQLTVLGYVAIGAVAALEQLEEKDITHFSEIMSEYCGQSGFVSDVMQYAPIVVEIFDLIEAWDGVFYYDVAEHFGWSLARQIIDGVVRVDPLDSLQIAGLNYQRVSFVAWEPINGDFDVRATIDEAMRDFVENLPRHLLTLEVHKLTEVFINGKLDHIKREKIR